MRMLLMDRSSPNPGMAVCEDGRKICGFVWEGAPTGSPAWMADVRNALRDAGVAPASLDLFVCGLGPGSFSGIRACLSALTGLALPGGKPVAGVASAEGIALDYAVASGRERITVIGDARRERLWIVNYAVDAASGRVRLLDGRVPTQTALDFRLVTSEELSAAVPPETTVLSPDATRLAPVLGRHFPPERLGSPSPVYPSIDGLCRIAFADRDACRKDPQPIYLQAAVAEKKPGTEGTA
ncbi:MAG: tRNA (adenosine(37)-N6)-threonylcarbamoyltransferase complex dimerization subunit type 1 TsaB [Kiritimatiellae bacterium]|nr:tRNA (adenosine(37)-N6)-threonylcarbamoyltransferase complex dimerization subunit type 1 TsaB [Kiritimatiellia bacterium]